MIALQNQGMHPAGISGMKKGPDAIGCDLKIAGRASDPMKDI
jgi:hypothetical protein